MKKTGKKLSLLELLEMFEKMAKAIKKSFGYFWMSSEF